MRSPVRIDFAYILMKLIKHFNAGLVLMLLVHLSRLLGSLALLFGGADEASRLWLARGVLPHR